jgi:hypothetical protein
MNKRIFLIAAAVSLVFLVFLQPSHGAYIWVDDQGVTHMTDYPKPSKEPEQQKEEPAPSEVPIELEVAPVEMEQVPEPAVSPPPVETKPIPLPVTAVTPSPVIEQTIKAAASVPTPTPQQVGQLPLTAPTTSPIPVPLMTPQQIGQVPITQLSGTQQSIPSQEMPDMQQEPRTGQPMPFMAHDLQTKMDPALMAGMGMVVLIIFAVIYIYSSLCLYLIAKKLDVPAAWTAWIPIVQVWAFLRSAGKSLVWVLLLLVPLVNTIVGVYLWMCISENCGRNKWLGLLMLLPIVNLIYLGVLAFSQSEA